VVVAIDGTHIRIRAPSADENYKWRLVIRGKWIPIATLAFDTGFDFNFTTRSRIQRGTHEN
jgi:hypothetical protein